MSEMSQQFTITLDSLLWRTRGRRWDHAFLLVPAINPKGGWHTAYKKVLASYGNLPPGKIGNHILSITGEDGKDIQISVATIADKRSDIAGRPIRHTFFYVLNSDDERFSYEKQRSVPSEWPAAVWNKLEPAFERPYQANAEYQADLKKDVDSLQLAEGVQLASKPAVTLDVVKLDLTDPLKPHGHATEKLPKPKMRIQNPVTLLIILLVIVTVAGVLLDRFPFGLGHIRRS